MLNILQQIYIDGFEEDGVSYAEYFCKNNKDRSVVFPQAKPVSAGYVIPRKLSDGNNCAYFSAIATLKAERGKGNASSLINQMLKKAQSEGFPFAVLSPFDSNFYLRYGFFTTQYYIVENIIGNEFAEISPVTDCDISQIEQLFNPSSIRLTFDKDYVSKLISETSQYGAKPFKAIKNGEVVAFFVKENKKLSRVVQKENALSKILSLNGYSYKRPALYGNAFIQVRILSLPGFLAFIKPIKPFSITVKINDSILTDNTGCWNISSDGVNIKAVKCNNSDYVVDIDNLVDFFEKNNLIQPFVTQFIDEY